MKQNTYIECRCQDPEEECKANGDVSNALASIRRCVIPHLLTSRGMLELAVITLVRTNTKLDGVGQTVEDVNRRLVLSMTLVCGIGWKGDWRGALARLRLSAV